MPFAEFNNGNAGLALPQFEVQSNLQTMDATSSLMQRAQQMQANQFDLERRKLMLSGDLALQKSTVDLNRLHVTQASNDIQRQQLELNVSQHRADAETAIADNLAEHEKAIADARKANSALIAQLPQDLQYFQQIPPENRTEYLSQMSKIQGKYGHLAGDPYYGQQFNTLMAPVLGDASMRNTTFGLLVNDAAAKMSASMAGANNLDDLSAVGQNPFFAYARQADPNFAKSYDERRKELTELEAKRYEFRVNAFNKTRELGLTQNDKFESNPDVVSYRKAQTAYLDAKDQLNDPNPTTYSDMAALTSYFKIIDPSMGFNASQEDIFKKLQNSKDRLAVSFRNMYTNKGGTLTPETRNDLQTAIETSFRAQSKSFNLLRNAYSQGLVTANLPSDFLPPEEGLGIKKSEVSYKIGQSASLDIGNGNKVTGTVIKNKSDNRLYIVDPNNPTIGYPIQQ